MKRAVFLVAALAATALAAGFQVQSYMSEAWDRHSFEVSAPGGGAKLWFTLPAGSGITVSITPDSGAAMTANLNLTGPVALKGAGDFKITVRRDSGAGQWACKDLSGGPALTRFTTTIDTLHSARMVINPDSDKETWTFTHPREVTFLVRQVNAAGKVYEEQDMDDSDRVDLVGGGSFTLDIVSTDGEGEFTASRK
jgi:hypothetical protein